MSESENSNFNAIIDEVMGDNSHSPSENEAEELSNQTNAPEEDVATDLVDGVSADSADEEKETVEEETVSKEETVEDKTNSFESERLVLEQELANYKKRLHDTQKAMHEANTQKAELQKQLDSIKNKKEEGESEDNWFSDEDKTVEQLGKEIAEVKEQSDSLKAQQEQYQRELNRQQWLKEAEEVAKDKKDFNELVFDKLEPLLKEESGDPMIRTLYMQEADGTPAGAYEFAKKLFGYKEKLSGASEEKTNNIKPSSSPVRGKAGLDRLSSAEFAETKKKYSNVVEEVFG
jgi:chromosome segregation ATPase